MKIKILPNGDINMLYTDEIPLHDFGKVFVQRASDVEYDHTRGGWTVHFMSGGWLGAGGRLVKDVTVSVCFRSRIAALEAEVCYLEALF